MMGSGVRISLAAPLNIFNVLPIFDPPQPGDRSILKPRTHSGPGQNDFWLTIGMCSGPGRATVAGAASAFSILWAASPHRMVGVTYKTAWFLATRIRESMADKNGGPLGGEGKVVEADETVVGGKAGNRAYWAIVEHMQDAIIWSLLKTGDRAGACVTAQMIGSRNRSLTIIALCKQFSLPKEVLDLAVKVSSHLYEPQKRRNRILHGPWYVDDAVSGTRQFRAMPPEDYSFGLVPSDVDYLKETLAIIDRCIDENWSP